MVKCEVCSVENEAGTGCCMACGYPLPDEEDEEDEEDDLNRPGFHADVVVRDSGCVSEGG